VIPDEGHITSHMDIVVLDEGRQPRHLAFATPDTAKKPGLQREPGFLSAVMLR
ncbi:hypothetical protein SAMN05216235_1822, partial [Salinicoccus halodurans]